ncbi:MAG: 16S rRNA (cytosine(1402)-N(4))-methyltransferase RsmH [Nakamurella sp.]
MNDQSGDLPDGAAATAADAAAAPRELDDIHTPILIDRIAELLAPALGAPDAVYVDATLGMAGHALRMLADHPQLRLIGVDRDPQALEIAGARIHAAGFADRAHLVHAVNDEISGVVDDLALRSDGTVNAVLFDLGVSSLQLDRTERGFAYSVDAPLDMRMDPTAPLTAAEVVNTYSVAELVRILRQYGEEKFAPRIASAIDRRRAAAPLAGSAELVELIRSSIPAAARRTGGHPGKRTFQALRIEVNDELGTVRRAVPAAMDALAVDGRIVVMSFHSLEDRIVKQEFAARSTSTTPLDLPMDLPGHDPEFRLVTRGMQAPSAAEIVQNPRANSAKLRAAQRIRSAA